MGDYDRQIAVLLLEPYMLDQVRAKVVEAVSDFRDPVR
jgi:hypothetical protein